MRPNNYFIALIRSAGLCPTRQRIALAKILFQGEDRHVTAEKLYNEALSGRMKISLATVYNTLRQFTEVGMLREISVDATRSYFDTNTNKHHHFYFEKDGKLGDIPDGMISIDKLPEAPDGTKIKSIDVVVTITDSNNDY
jgi:Fur family transcriptional regulator, iron response regulator